MTVPTFGQAPAHGPAVGPEGLDLGLRAAERCDQGHAVIRNPHERVRPGRRGRHIARHGAGLVDRHGPARAQGVHDPQVAHARTARPHEGVDRAVGQFRPADHVTQGVHARGSSLHPAGPFHAERAEVSDRLDHPGQGHLRHEGPGMPLGVLGRPRDSAPRGHRDRVGLVATQGPEVRRARRRRPHEPTHLASRIVRISDHQTGVGHGRGLHPGAACQRRYRHGFQAEALVEPRTRDRSVCGRSHDRRCRIRVDHTIQDLHAARHGPQERPRLFAGIADHADHQVGIVDAIGPSRAHRRSAQLDQTVLRGPDHGPLVTVEVARLTDHLARGIDGPCVAELAADDADVAHPGHHDGIPEPRRSPAQTGFRITHARLVTDVGHAGARGPGRLAVGRIAVLAPVIGVHGPFGIAGVIDQAADLAAVAQAFDALAARQAVAVLESVAARAVRCKGHHAAFDWRAGLDRTGLAVVAHHHEGDVLVRGLRHHSQRGRGGPTGHQGRAGHVATDHGLVVHFPARPGRNRGHVEGHGAHCRVIDTAIRAVHEFQGLVQRINELHVGQRQARVVAIGNRDVERHARHHAIATPGPLQCERPAAIHPHRSRGRHHLDAARSRDHGLIQSKLSATHLGAGLESHGPSGPGRQGAHGPGQVRQCAVIGTRARDAARHVQGRVRHHVHDHHVGHLDARGIHHGDRPGDHVVGLVAGLAHVRGLDHLQQGFTLGGFTQDQGGPKLAVDRARTQPVDRDLAGQGIARDRAGLHEVVHRTVLPCFEGPKVPHHPSGLQHAA